MFQWPPILKASAAIWRTQGIGYLFYHWEAYGRLPYVPAFSGYSVPWGRNVSGEEWTRLRGQVGAEFGTVTSSGVPIAYTYNDVTFVQENYSSEFSELYSMVYYSGAGGSGYLLHGNSIPLTLVPLPALAVQAPGQAWAFQGNSTGVHVFFLANIEVGSSMMTPIYEQRLCYNFYTFSSSSFGTSQVLFTPEASMDTYMDMCDAGEGHFYLQYRAVTTIYLRKVDCTAATPTVSGLLGGSGAGLWATAGAGPLTGRNQQDRFVVVGGNRYIFFHCSGRFVRIQYTSGTKDTPTVYIVEGDVIGSNSITIEYDPLDETTRMVRWYSTPNGSESIEIHAQWLDPMASPPVWAGTVTAAVVNTHPETTATNIANGGRGIGAAAARLGESVNSIVVVVTEGFLVMPGCVGASFSLWHTPVEFIREVDAVTTYGGVSVGTSITRTRQVDATTTYGGVSLYLAKDGWAGATYRWFVGESSEVHIAVDAVSTYSAVSLDVEIVTLFTVDMEQYWTNVGTTWMDDFMVYLNIDRADVGLPPYKTWGVDGQFVDRRNVANMHSDNMAWYREFAHESGVFPQNQRTIVERRAACAALGMAENVMFSAWHRYSTGSTVPHITAFQAWENWHNSPGHYANMVFNWGAANDKVYSMIGVCDGANPTAYPDFDDWAVTYLCNNFVYLETLMFEVQLNQYWDNSGALVAVLPQGWSNSAWVHVERQHAAKYSLRVANSHQAWWGCRVARQHSAPITFSAQMQAGFLYTQTGPVATQHVGAYHIVETNPVAVEHEGVWALQVSRAFAHEYALLQPVAAQHQAGYSIKDTQPVQASWEAVWASRVAAVHTATHALLAAVSTQHSASYAVSDTQPVATEHQGSYALQVASSHSGGWSLHLQVARQHQARYGEVDPVRTQHLSGYHLLASNPVVRVCSHYYNMADFGSIIPANNQVFLILQGGHRIAIDDGVLDNNESDVGYRFECSIARLDDFALLSEDDPVQVDFCGEVYDLLIQEKTIDRSSPAGPTLRMTANSAVARLGSPYSSDISYAQDGAKLASELVDELIEIDFNYQIVDWLVFDGRLQADNNTPLAIVKQVAEAAGGVVDSLPDGSMVIRYPYPYPMNTIESAPVDQVYIDETDHLSMNSTSIFRDGANRFRIREGDASFRDMIEWIPDEPQTDPLYITGELRAYLSPWRDTVEIRHLGGAVYLEDRPTATQQHEEMVEFSEGEGGVRYPIDTILSVEWVTPALGSLTFSPFSTVINTPTSVERGYGLAKVTYTTRHLTARAAGVPVAIPAGEVGPATAYAHFILEDTHA